MPKFIVTNSTGFQPFTYDELMKPILMQQEVHNATQDAYDKLSMETSALENYISKNEGDKRARQMYENYMSRLSQLQDDLWSNGINPNTRRDLSIARDMYASDINRIAKAIQTRQERSKEYWDAKKNNPNLVTGSDPGLGGLDNYLDDDNYGRNWFSYDSAKFEKSISDEWSARAAGMLRGLSDPNGIIKNDKLRSQLTRVLTKGITNDELYTASRVVDDVMGMGDVERDKYYRDNKIDDIPQLLVESLLNRYDATGINQSDASPEERRRLLNSGKAGWSSAVLGYDVKDFTDPDYEMELAAYKAALTSKGTKKSGSGSGDDERVIPTYTYNGVGDGAEIKSQYPSLFNHVTRIITKDGVEVNSAPMASSIVFSDDYRRTMSGKDKIGFDPGRNPESSPEGEIERNGKVYEVKYFPKGTYTTSDGKKIKGVMVTREKGSNTPWEKAKPNHVLSEQYKDAYQTVRRTANKYRVEDPKLFKLALELDPDKQYNIYKDLDIDFNEVPLSRIEEYMNTLYKDAHNIHRTFIAQKETDQGNLIGRIAGAVARNFNISIDGNNKAVAERNPQWRVYDGTTRNLHLMKKNGMPEDKSIKDPNEVFTFDKDGNIDNIISLEIDANGIKGKRSSDTDIADGCYIIAHTREGKEVAIGLNMIQNDVIRNLFLQGSNAIRHGENPDQVAKDISDILYHEFNFAFETQHKQASTKED